MIMEKQLVAKWQTRGEKYWVELFRHADRVNGG